jgi:putative tryptophan/tyrosine transport system substrate-binding protein
MTAFRQGLKETGFVEGQDVAIEYRWAEGRYDRIRGLVADLNPNGSSPGSAGEAAKV